MIAVTCNYIFEHDICEDYLLERLGMGDRVVFEHHCVGCPECFGKLAVVKSLLRLAGSAAQDRWDA